MLFLPFPLDPTRCQLDRDTVMTMPSEHPPSALALAAPASASHGRPLPLRSERVCCMMACSLRELVALGDDPSWYLHDVLAVMLEQDAAFDHSRDAFIGEVELCGDTTLARPAEHGSELLPWWLHRSTQ